MSQKNIIVRQPIFGLNISITDDMFDAIENLESESWLKTSVINDIVKTHGTQTLDRLDQHQAIIEQFRNERGVIDQYQICLWGDKQNPTPDNMMAVFCKISQTTESVPQKNSLFGKTMMVDVPVITTAPVLAICGKNLSSLLIYQMDCCRTNSAVVSVNMGDDFISFNRDPASGISNKHHLVFDSKVRRATVEDKVMFEQYIQNGFKSLTKLQPNKRMISPIV